MDQSAIRRRIDFLLTEARSTDSAYCHAVQTMMRVVSNELLFQNWSSRHAKKNAMRMSRQALELSKLVDPKRFSAETINEHPIELRSVWEKIKSSADDLCIEDVEKILREDCLPIVITKEEDAKLRKSKKQGVDRYKEAGIEILIFKNGQWILVT